MRIERASGKKHTGRQKASREVRVMRGIAMGQLAACLLLVMGMLWASFYFERGAVSERSMDWLVKDYYENYFYDLFVDGREGSEELFAWYKDQGFAEITLRQLLLVDGGRNVGRKWDFEHCDKIKSAVKYIPVAPFGKKDYTAEIRLVCE